MEGLSDAAVEAPLQRRARGGLRGSGAGGARAARRRPPAAEARARRGERDRRGARPPAQAAGRGRRPSTSSAPAGATPWRGCWPRSRRALRPRGAGPASRTRRRRGRRPRPDLGDARAASTSTASASAWLIRRFIDPEARFKFVRRPRTMRRRPESCGSTCSRPSSRTRATCARSRCSCAASGCEEPRPRAHRRDRPRHRPEGRQVRPPGDGRPRPPDRRASRCATRTTRRGSRDGARGLRGPLRVLQAEEVTRDARRCVLTRGDVQAPARLGRVHRGGGGGLPPPRRGAEPGARACSACARRDGRLPHQGGGPRPGPPLLRGQDQRELLRTTRAGTGCPPSRASSSSATPTTGGRWR